MKNIVRYPQFFSILFSTTLIVQAFLLFFVQPLMGKMLLPLVGGTPSLWNVVMAFFQFNLLLGYGLANFTTRFSPIQQTVFVFCLYGISFTLLPFDIDENVFTQAILDRKISQTLFWQLAMVVGFPFLALSMTTSTLQRLFTRTPHPDSNDPYFLYSASNIGSFLGLLSYPLIFEPLTTVPWQLNFWTWVFGIAAGTVLTCIAITAMLHSHRNKEKKVPDIKEKAHNPQRLTWKRRAYLFLLAAIPSSLMLGVTTSISQDIGAFPLLWVIPLALYLLTFVYAFSRKRKLHSARFNTLLLSLILYSCTYFILFTTQKLMLLPFLAVFGIIFLLGVFLLAALLCHIRLVDERPPADQLTEFYFIMSLGGAAGGAFNAFLAPLLFKTPLEVPLVLSLSLLALINLSPKPAQNTNMLNKIAFYAFLFSLVMLGFSNFSSLPSGVSNIIPTLLLLSGLFTALKTRYLILHLIFLSFFFAPMSKNLVHIHRNFFGITKIIQEHVDDIGTRRKIVHGNTNHGFSIIDNPEYANKPLGYYVTEGPLGKVSKKITSKNIAVFGLGTGQASCFFQSPSQKVTFFEIDPDMAEIAKVWFPFSTHCPADIIIGDARVALRSIEDSRYDIIIIDAFSSDSIPLHLLTTQALQEYRVKLKPEGMILFHISNRYYDLRKPLIANSMAIDAHIKTIKHLPDKEKFSPELYSPTIWAAISWDKATLSKLSQLEWQEHNSSNDRPWTDNYTNPVGNFFGKLMNE